ncbi:uncharacterized protein LOC126325807 isoform X1 [Schistocerca gregaria]|uniref:uncharacterized protein LOC126325807 isoform X1 n=1 Tax=Schistocerca gregaria TaxID=7010 RepID=UPI00211F4440|nr:uncharacterized protein LOC126325807 isoform X1 [Schistocerca gregaria]
MGGLMCANFAAEQKTKPCAHSGKNVAESETCGNSVNSRVQTPLLRSKQTCVSSYVQIPVKTVAENESCGKSNSKYNWKTVTYKKKDKCESNPAKQIVKSDFFVIGDSILKNVVVPNCKVDVRSGIRPHQIVKHFSNIRNTEKSNQNNNDSNTNFKAVIIHVGTNSIRSSRQEEIINDIRNVIRSAKDLYTNSRIVINGILQRRSLKNFYKVKKTYPKHLECCLPSKKGYVYDMDIMTVLDQKDNDGRIVVIMRFEKLDYRKIAVEECFQTIATVLSFCCEDPHVQISGAVFIVDMTGYGLQHFLVATPSNLSLFIKMFQDGFPLRLKAVHIVNAPSVFATVFAISKPFLKEKMRQRIHVHGRNMSSLHEYVPYEILPKQLGGMVPDFNFNSFRHKLQQNESMIKAWNKYGYGMEPQDNFEIGMSK